MSKTEKQKAEVSDLGQGLFAAVQREILEVLLNEPKLFETVGQKITVEIFDVPILSRIAGMLFEILSAEIPDCRDLLSKILAKAESVQVSNAIVQLAQAGEEKGNFKARLTGAMDAIQRVQCQRKMSEIKAVEDQKQFLQRVCEIAGKDNPHSVGMV